MKLDFVFVCQSGPLEAAAALLAASLTKFGPADFRLHVIEPLPSHEYGTVTNLSRRYFAALGAKWYQRTNPISHEYKIGNKLNAFDIAAEGERVVFMDSDTLLIRKFPEYETAFARQFSAVAAMKHHNAGINNESVTRAFGLFGLKQEDLAWPCRENLAWGHPYFNAGFIVVDSACQFSQAWTEVARRLYSSPEIANRVPWLDQIALSIVVVQKGLEYSCLSQEYNYLAYQGYNQDHLPVVLHYQNPRLLAVWPGARQLVKELAAEFHIEEIIALDPRWRSVIRRWGRSRSHRSLMIPTRPSTAFVESCRPWTQRFGRAFQRRTRPLLFLSGIVGAGARDLGRFLATQPGIAVVHDFEVPSRRWDDFEDDSRESEDEWEARMAAWRARDLPFLSRALRESVRAWRAAVQKVSAEAGPGDFLDRVLTAGAEQSRVSGTTDADGRMEQLVFVNELGFLMSLPDLRLLFPSALIVKVVRSPVDTLARWAGQTEQWNVDLKAQLPGVVPSLQSRWFLKRSLAQLLDVASPEQRRAGFWTMQAALELQHDARFLVFAISRESEGRRSVRASLDRLGRLLGRTLIGDMRAEPAENPDAITEDAARVIQKLCADEVWRLGLARGIAEG